MPTQDKKKTTPGKSADQQTTTPDNSLVESIKNAFGSPDDMARSAIKTYDYYTDALFDKMSDGELVDEFMNFSSKIQDYFGNYFQSDNEKRMAADNQRAKDNAKRAEQGQLPDSQDVKALNEKLPTKESLGSPPPTPERNPSRPKDKNVTTMAKTSPVSTDVSPEPEPSLTDTAKEFMRYLKGNVLPAEGLDPEMERQMEQMNQRILQEEKNKTNTNASLGVRG